MSRSNFWCITPYFNPAKYESIQKNWSIFSHELRKRKINLLTVELSFDGSYDIPLSHDVLRLRSNSVMWQKERLINYGIENLPSNCKSFAWVDCDVLFEQEDWVEQTIEKLKTNDIVQLFKRIYYLSKEAESYTGKYDSMMQSVIWQNKIHKNWLVRRKMKDLPFSHPGFAWAANKSTFPNGIYDRNIIGSGDTFIVDCVLDSWEIHGFAKKFTQKMREEMEAWALSLPKLKYDYIPQSIYHLYHGSLKNRAYMDRHDILKENDFDPVNDIKIVNHVFEWASNKPNMHNAIIEYFKNRQEDEQ